MVAFQFGQMSQPGEGASLPYILLLVAAAALALLLADRVRLVRRLKRESAACQEAVARALEGAGAKDPGMPGPAPAAALSSARPGDAAGAVPAAESDLLEPSRIEELRALGLRTGRDLLGSLATLFRESSFQQLAELRQAFEARDPQAAQRAAHSLKGSAGNIGATEIAELARQIEEAGRAQAIDSVRPRFDRLAGQLPRVAEELERVAAARLSR